MLGLPGTSLPVITNVQAGSWLIALVWTVLTRAMSSTHLRGVRQQLADPRAALAVLRELELRRGDREAAPGRWSSCVIRWPMRIAVGQVLVEVLGELRLVVPACRAAPARRSCAGR